MPKGKDCKNSWCSITFFSISKAWSFFWCSNDLDVRLSAAGHCPTTQHFASILHVINFTLWFLEGFWVEKLLKWGSTCSIWSQTEEADVQLPSDLAKNHPAKGEDMLECNWTPGSLVSVGPRLNARKEQVKRGGFWIKESDVKIWWFSDSFLWHTYLSRWFRFEFAKPSFGGILSSRRQSHPGVWNSWISRAFHTFWEGKPAFRFQRGRFLSVHKRCFLGRIS